MAMRGYEFYLRALKVSLTSERSERVGDTFSTSSVYYIDTGEISKTTKSGCLLQNAFHRNVMKLRYKVIKEN